MFISYSQKKKCREPNTAILQAISLERKILAFLTLKARIPIWTAIFLTRKEQKGAMVVEIAAEGRIAFMAK